MTRLGKERIERPRSRTLVDLLDEMAARQPARELVGGGATRLTYAEARARVCYRSLGRAHHDARRQCR